MIYDMLEDDEVFSKVYSGTKGVLFCACSSLSGAGPVLQLVKRTPLDADACIRNVHTCISHTNWDLCLMLLEAHPYVLSDAGDSECLDLLWLLPRRYPCHCFR